MTRILPNGGSFNQAVAAEYLALLRGLPAFALEAAFEDFRQGVAGDPKWMPWPIEIKQHAESIAAARYRLDKIEIEEKAEIERVAKFKAGLIQRTPEERERVEARVKKLKEELSQAVLVDADEAMKRDAAYKASIKRVDERFSDSYRFGDAAKWGWEP